MIKETRLLVYLTSIVFNTEIMRYGSVVFDDKVIKKVSSIDENASWVNGLQAVAYETEGRDWEKTLSENRCGCSFYPESE